MTDSYNFDITLHPWGADHGVVGIDTAALYGYWERKDGSEGGGLWFCRELIGSRLDQLGPLELIDFDGASDLPKAVKTALVAAGIYLDEFMMGKQP